MIRRESRLLCVLLLLGVLGGATSQPSNDPEPLIITDPLIDPVPVASCRSPTTRTKPPGPKCNYYMVVPFKLTSGCDGVVCTWLKCEVPVTVKVTMEYYFEKNIIVSKEDTTEYFECTDFTVPQVEKQEAIYFIYEAVGDNVKVIARKPAVIDVPRTACLAQKNKPLYKPGDTVQLRLPCFDENLKQVVKNFTKFTVADPTGIRVFQELNPTIDHGVATLSFVTSDLSREGYWGIQFEDDKGQIQYSSFQLQLYELPRFDWNTKCPNTISVLDKKAEISGSAQYVYGKPVPGTVVVRCCRTTPKYGRTANCFRGVDDICVEFTKELDENGNFTEQLDLDVFKLPFSGLDNSITCDMTMKEDGTGILVPSYCYMSITNKLAVLLLDRTIIGTYYNKVNVLFVATLTDEKNNPLAYKEITVQIDGVDVKYVTTDANGRAECEIDTSQYYKANITLTATYSPSDLCYGEDSFGSYYAYSVRSYPYDEVILYRYYSQSKSQIRARPLTGVLPCHLNHRVQLDYSFTEEGVGKDATTINIYYIIISRNTIAKHGDISVDLSEGLKGFTYIEFYADYKVATEAKVLVFVATAKDIISDTVSLEIGLCFENEVNLAFTKPIVAPGATVERRITAEPGSFCGLRAKDASFNLIAQYDEFNANDIHSRVRSYLFGLQYGDVDYKDPEPPCIDGNTENFCNGVYVKPTSARTDRDSNQDFEEYSLLLFSNLDKRRPKVCGEETEPVYPKYYASSIETIGSFADAGSAKRSIDTVRDDFRDIFGYDTTIIGSGGESIVSSKIPQTITNWESDAFCISSTKGIGLTIDPAKTTTIQPFFVEASGPPSVTRGEKVDFSITAANYLNKCTQIKAEVENSENYEVTFPDGVQEKCACSQQRVSWTVSVTFLRIGTVNLTMKASTTKVSDTCDGSQDDAEPLRSDTIIQGIDVEAEGIKREAASSHLVTVKDGTAAVEISVREPNDLVPDSFRCIVNIMGDPVALSVENFDNLLSTQTSCCDQIQAELLSIIFLERYLKTFGELSEDQSKKMLAKFASGYMNLLSCRQYDGGYSWYRSSFTSNLWGTVSSLRTIHFLSDYVYIDDSVPTNGLIYISRFQDLKSGCLNPETPSIIYQDHYNASIQITAMAAPILQELSGNYSSAGPLLEGVNKCLKNVYFERQNTLTQCYLFNAAASRGDWDTWQSYYIILLGKAIYNGDTCYWESDNSVRPVIYHYFPRSSGDILSTAIVLISLTKYPDPGQDLINQMASIAKWLSGQLTRTGGWYSSQATSAAIEALTLFGRIINTGETNAQVSLQRDGIEVFSVTIDRSNKFIVQSKELSPCFGEYKFIVTGTDSPLLQLATFYNTKIATGEDSAYIISAQASSPHCFGGVARLVNIKISLRFNGASGGYSRTYLRVDIFTGYQPDYSIQNKIPNVREYKVKGRKALIVIEIFDTKTIEFTIPIYLRSRVTTFQRAYIVAEDIDTGETGIAEYRYPCND